MKRTFKYTIFTLAMIMATSLTSCLSDDNETIVLESGNNSGIPSDELADPNPTIGSSTTNIPNIQYTVEQDGNDAIVRIDMTGIQDADTNEWLELIGTAEDGQNIWVEVDGNPKGISVYNNSNDEGQTVMADLVFIVDNSGSMSEESDAIARDIIKWSQLLESSNLDINFACVGYGYNYGEISGALNLTDAKGLSKYLNRNTGTGRTYGFYGTDATTLQNAASKYSAGGECGGMAIQFANNNFNFRHGSNRIYVNLTDEPNQPGTTSEYSVEYYKSQYNWPTSSGTVHTVFSSDTINFHGEKPWRISQYTGGTILIAPSDFSGVTLESLPITGAMTNSYVIRFTNISEYMDCRPHLVTITVLSEDGRTRAERSFYITFGCPEE